jgi:glycosyltransferase involved in cell wall biosynthesis
MAHDLKELYAVRTFVAHNACHIHDPGARHAPADASGLTIGFLSNISLEKGLDTVLLSLEAIRTSGIEARLVLGGPIVDERARTLISQAHSKFGKAIVEMGAISGATKHAFFETIDIFLFPSRYRMEAQPLVVLEALSYGVAALVTPQGYSAEIVEPLGTVAEASNFVSFAMEFARAWSRDSGFATHHRTAARARFLELFELSRYQTTQLLSLLTGS